MYEALRMTPHRAGNLEKLKLMIDSRNGPWSAAERLSHRLLRAAHITGWETNLPVYIDGRMYYFDIAFRQKLAIEIDGRRHETDEDLFESNRWRQNVLVVADGWRVLRFTWAMLRNHPGAFVSTVVDALH
jgi:very-short-patch-repair endonuclease